MNICTWQARGRSLVARSKLMDPYALPTRRRVVAVVERKLRMWMTFCRRCFLRWVDRAEAITKVGSPTGYLKTLLIYIFVLLKKIIATSKDENINKHKYIGT